MKILSFLPSSNAILLPFHLLLYWLLIHNPYITDTHYCLFIVYYFDLIVLKNMRFFYFFLKVSSVTQFSFTICLLRPTAKALSGTFLVIVEPAPT